MFSLCQFTGGGERDNLARTRVPPPLDQDSVPPALPILHQDRVPHPPHEDQDRVPWSGPGQGTPGQDQDREPPTQPG